MTNNMEKQYSKREIDLLHESIHTKLDTVIEKIDFTNGKVKKIILALAIMFGLLIGAGSEHVPTVLGLIL